MQGKVKRQNSEQVADHIALVKGIEPGPGICPDMVTSVAYLDQFARLTELHHVKV